MFQNGPDRVRPITLADQVGDPHPNQGMVFRIAEDDRFVVKLFASPRSELVHVVALCADRGLRETTSAGIIVAAPWWTVSSEAHGDPIGCTSPILDPTKYDELTLYLKIEAGDASVEDRIDIAATLAKGVAWLHERPRQCLIGDLKPDNLLRHDNGLSIGIIDVDSFTFLDAEGVPVLANRVMTDNYRAPEITTAAVPTYDSDRFALGVIALEVLFGGRHPYKYVARDDPDAVVQRRIQQRAPWILAPTAYWSEEHHPGIEILPSWIHPTVERCLMTTSRPTAGEWADALAGLRPGRCGFGHQIFEGGLCWACAKTPVPAFASGLGSRSSQLLDRLRRRPVEAVWAASVLLLIVLIVWIAVL